MISFDKYAGACNEFEWELKQCLTREDINALRNDCFQMGFYKWCAWVRENDDIIGKFVEASPSARKKKAWQKSPLRLRLVLAAIQYVTTARDLLRGIDDMALYYGYSYREMAAKAARAYRDIFYCATPFWPFEAPSPFE